MARSRRTAIAVATILALAASAGGGPRGQATKTDRPVRLGLVEEAGVELTLLDVELTDKDGRPIRAGRAPPGRTEPQESKLDFEISGASAPRQRIRGFARSRT